MSMYSWGGDLHDLDTRLDCFFPCIHLLMSFKGQLTCLDLSVGEFERVLG